MRTAGTWPGPDWYSDPSGRHALRYWDGDAWTGAFGTLPRSIDPAPIARSAAPLAA